MPGTTSVSFGGGFMSWASWRSRSAVCTRLRRHPEAIVGHDRKKSTLNEFKDRQLTESYTSAELYQAKLGPTVGADLRRP